ncbi:MAG: metal-dependent hydrolase [Aureispira sp.]|nr:metal-dependent hydrolase [Aureispira sp.]
MDSITQAALGAAMGEAVLGRKMGNRALLIGAVAGTIPDLDVLSRLFLDNQVYGLLYHRGITHSILFTLLAAPFFGWLAYRYYENELYARTWMQGIWAAWWGLFYLVIMAAFVGLSYWTTHWVPILMTGGLAIGAYYVVKTLVANYKNPDLLEIKASFKSWTLMFFLAFLTHWLIDACTAYGTQIFEPFSRYRVAFNNIFIIDPLYTGPLLIGIGAAFFIRNRKKRATWNNIGIGLSTLYMAFTFYAKSVADGVIQSNLDAQGISYTEFISYPTIANCVLWQTTVITEDAYYYGLYSLLDTEPKVEFIKLPKNHELLDQHKNHELVKILLWFAQDYYNITKREDGVLQFNNLRFGLMGGGMGDIKDPYVFKFRIGQHNGEFDVWQDRELDEDWKIGDILGQMWTRLKGI